jgi:drug/metabolite transporter (DMT)-like permease
MGVEIGILFAFGALFFWGFGDFLIQRTTRKLGDWETLFIVTLFGTLILLPFIYADVQRLLLMEDNTFLILISMSTVLMIAALLDFEALKKGKIAIVEPIFALEIPITAIITFMLINEGVDVAQIMMISLLMLGLIMLSLKSHHFKRKAWVERGVILAAVASIFFGLANFLMGVSSRITNPILANWFLNAFIAMICLFYLFSNKKLGKTVSDFNSSKKLILSMCIFDNFAWVFIAFAATFIPIAIAFALSESYVALSALLGIIINREILMRHQKAGLAITLMSTIALSIVTL